MKKIIIFLFSYFISSFVKIQKTECIVHTMLLPSPTAEWSASLEQTRRKVMVTPLLLLSFGREFDDKLLTCPSVQCF